MRPAADAAPAPLCRCRRRLLATDVRFVLLGHALAGTSGNLLPGASFGGRHLLRLAISAAFAGKPPAAAATTPLPQHAGRVRPATAPMLTLPFCDAGAQLDGVATAWHRRAERDLAWGGTPEDLVPGSPINCSQPRSANSPEDALAGAKAAPDDAVFGLQGRQRILAWLLGSALCGALLR